MAKIHILGGSGSGKTTLARDLSSLLHLPHYDLYEIGLKNGLVTEDDAFAIAGQPGWISEGCYLIWTEPLLSQADCNRLHAFSLGGGHRLQRRGARAEGVRPV